ncbi:MAG TPA: alpha-galactosidase [Pseudonocardiaceae bacterium]|nr:alpha-galactosidase [Pseudonocardiaceae bacterium]
MSSITFAAAERLWLLSTPNSAYALRLADDDTPTHVYWGPPRSLAEVTALPVARPHRISSFETLPDPDELAVAAGARFGPPSLAVRFADGTSAVEWAYGSHDISGQHLALRLTDRHYPLAVTLHYRVHDDSDVIERWTKVSTDEPLTLSRLDSANWTLPGTRVSYVAGGWSAEYQVHRTPVPVAETVFTSRRGITGHQANPWLMLDAGDADEDHGEVWSMALAWSGSWRFTLHRDPTERVTCTGGFGHDGVHWELGAGESLTSPVFAGAYTRDGFGAASRTWHGFVRSHVLPRPDELRPVLYNSWEATGFDVTEAGQRALADIAAELGVELFVMDDGWFGGRRDDTAGLGDWRPYPGAFPNGLRPLADHVHELGMRFGLWVEPEMVNPDSDLYRSHPDWVLHQDNRRRTTLRNQLVLNFGRPDVADWAFEWLDRLVTENAVDHFKWDCNRPFTEPGWPDHDDRFWIDHTRGVHRTMRRLRASHQGLRIEACSGGGGRTDMGIMAYTDQVWTSDNTDAADRIAIQHGYSQIYPAQTMGAWITDCPNPFTARTTPLLFRCHVAMAGALGVGGNLTTWSAADRELVAGQVALYREIRSTVQFGRQYRLAHGPGLTVVEYAGSDEAVVFGWRISEAFGHRPALVRLAGLDPVANYQDSRTGTVHTGSVLQERGISLDLPAGDHVSVLIRLRRVS